MEKNTDENKARSTAPPPEALHERQSWILRICKLALYYINYNIFEQNFHQNVSTHAISITIVEMIFTKHGVYRYNINILRKIDWYSAKYMKSMTIFARHPLSLKENRQNI